MDDPDAMDFVKKDGTKPYKEPYVHWVLYNFSAYMGLTFEDTKDLSARQITIPKAIPTSTAPLTKLDWDQAKGRAEFMKNSEVIKQYMREQYGTNFAMVGVNDFGEFAYGGPAPPDKKHKYFFRLYAVDFGGLTAYKSLEETDNPSQAASKRLVPTITKDAIMKKMEEQDGKHILGKTTLTGTYAP